ncbi:unnamed protein product [Vitrella brassicaformis CCMP3155]|uniref:EamA domain-containing protein n=2 Tax=Vitrella brassicaformis TaxID=1169539 RepID=A0A0G4EES6_VITBC|nr:unnamed protein product [Vitrella brassicaformis CCMP3155]|eukprot:CEL94506.1 unnamed protein product [Vitrella brassicaformis CCMP3155]
MWRHVDPRSLAWSFFAMLFLGFSYFMLGLTNVADELDIEHLFTISLVWMWTGIVGLLAALYFWMTVGTMWIASRGLEIKFPPSDGSPQHAPTDIIVAPPPFQQHASVSASPVPPIHHADTIGGTIDEENDRYLPQPPGNGYVPLSGEPPPSPPPSIASVSASVSGSRAGADEREGMSGGAGSSTRPLAPPPDLSMTGATPTLQVAYRRRGRLRRTCRKIMIIIMTGLGGVFLGFAQLSLKLGFEKDPPAMGPFSAITSADVVFVTCFFHCTIGDRLTRIDLPAFVAVLAGLCTMALADPRPEHLYGLAWSSLAALGMAVSVILIRWGAMNGVSAYSGFVIRMLSEGIMGILTLIAVLSTGFSVPGHGFFVWTRLVIFPSACGIFQAIAVFCVNKALMYPKPGISTALVGANPLVVFFCQLGVGREYPRTVNLVGMLLVVAGCLALTLSRAFSASARASAGSPEGPHGARRSSNDENNSAMPSLHPHPESESARAPLFPFNKANAMRNQVALGFDSTGPHMDDSQRVIAVGHAQSIAWSSRAGSIDTVTTIGYGNPAVMNPPSHRHKWTVSEVAPAQVPSAAAAAAAGGSLAAAPPIAVPQKQSELPEDVLLNWQLQRGVSAVRRLPSVDVWAFQ